MFVNPVGVTYLQLGKLQNHPKPRRGDIFFNLKLKSFWHKI